MLGGPQALGNKSTPRFLQGLKPLRMTIELGQPEVLVGDMLCALRRINADKQSGGLTVPPGTWMMVSGRVAYTTEPGSLIVGDWQPMVTVGCDVEGEYRATLLDAQMLRDCARWPAAQTDDGARAELGVMVLKVPGDHHCLYASVGAGTGQPARTFRGKAAVRLLRFMIEIDGPMRDLFGPVRARQAWLLKHTEEFRDSDAESYLLDQAPGAVAGERVWGDVCMLYHLSQEIQQPIVMLSAAPDNRFDPLAPGTCVVIPEGWQGDALSTSPVVVLFQETVTSTGVVVSAHFDCVLLWTTAAQKTFKDYINDVVLHNQQWRPTRVSAVELHRSAHQLLHDFGSTTYDRMHDLLSEFAPQDNHTRRALKDYQGDMLLAPVVRTLVNLLRI